MYIPKYQILTWFPAPPPLAAFCCCNACKNDCIDWGLTAALPFNNGGAGPDPSLANGVWKAVGVAGPMDFCCCCWSRLLMLITWNLKPIRWGLLDSDEIFRKWMWDNYGSRLFNSLEINSSPRSENYWSTTTNHFMTQTNFKIAHMEIKSGSKRGQISWSKWPRFLIKFLHKIKIGLVGWKFWVKFRKLETNAWDVLYMILKGRVWRVRWWSKYRIWVGIRMMVR